MEGFGIPIPADVGNENVNQKKTILILGGAGGVGSIAVQIAKHVRHKHVDVASKDLTHRWCTLQVLKIGRVIASASRQETIEYVKQFGADETINHQNPLADELSKLGLKGVDYVFNTSEPDPVIDQLIALINPLGKIGHILEIKKAINTGPLFVRSLIPPMNGRPS